MAEHHTILGGKVHVYEHGSRRKSTGSFMRQRGNAPRTPNSRVFGGKRNNFTIMFCSPPTPDSAPTRRGVFSSAMSR